MKGLSWSGPNLQKLGLMALAVLTLALGGLVAVSRARLAQLQQELAAQQQQVAALTSRNTELQQQLTGLEADRKTLESRLNDLNGQLTSASKELARLRTAAVEFQARSEALEGEKTTLEAKVSRLTKEWEEDHSRVGQLEKEREDLKRLAARLRERYSLLDRDYRQLAEKLAKLEEAQQQAPPPSVSPQGAGLSPSSSTASPSNQPLLNSTPVELPPIIVRKDQAGSHAPIRGRLVEVSQPHQFVVIDKGANDGVRAGMTFDILRSGGVIAQAVAVRIRATLTACDLIGSRTAGSPQAGDLAIEHGS